MTYLTITYLTIFTLIFLCETGLQSPHGHGNCLDELKQSWWQEWWSTGSIAPSYQAKGTISSASSLDLMASFPMNSVGTGSTSSPGGSSGLLALWGPSPGQPLLLRIQYEGFRQKKAGCGMPYFPEKNRKWSVVTQIHIQSVILLQTCLSFWKIPVCPQIGALSC